MRDARLLLCVLAVAALATTGCAVRDGAHDHSRAGPPGTMGGGMMHGRMAVASLSPTQGNDVRGLVMFHQMEGQVMVHAIVTGLKPNGEHGFHVHETGNCASVDGTSAGGHFNPDGKPHGPPGGPHHAGDMPALKADANGRADQRFRLVGVTTASGPTALAGRSVVVHALPDDYTTQPTGNSGARLACGVIAAH